MSKKSKTSTLLRQISQLEAEVTQLREAFFNNMVLFHDVRKKAVELNDEEYYRNKYFQLIWSSKALCSGKGYGMLSPVEREHIKKVSRKQMRKESKKVIKEGLIEHELVTSVMMEELALDNIYAESLRDFLESEVYRQWEEEDELKERYDDLAYPDDDIGDPYYFEDDIDDGGPYYGIGGF